MKCALLVLIGILCVQATEHSSKPTRRAHAETSPVSSDWEKNVSNKRPCIHVDPTVTTTVSGPLNSEYTAMEGDDHKDSANEDSSLHVSDDCANGTVIACMDAQIQDSFATGSSVVDMDRQQHDGCKLMHLDSRRSGPKSSAQIQYDLALLRNFSGESEADPVIPLRRIHSECLIDQCVFVCKQGEVLLEDCLVSLSARFKFSYNAPHLNTEIEISPYEKLLYGKFVYGIFTGSVEIVNGCLSMGLINMNRLVHDRMTDKCHHLMYMAVAVKGFSLDIVKTLILRCFNINQVVENGMNLLHVAILFQKLHLIEFLLSRGADVNARDSRGLTPIMMAFYIGNICIVQILIATGKVDLFTSTGKRLASEFIFASGNARLFEKLLDMPTLIDPQVLSLATIFFTPQSRALFEEVIAMLLKTDKHPEIIIDIVRFFVAQGDVKTVQFFKNQNVRLDLIVLLEARTGGNTLMHLAVLSGSVEMVRFLRECNVQIDVPDEEGRTPLLIAIICGSTHMVWSLILAGAKIHLLEALCYGVSIGNMNIVRKTLLLTADVDDMDCTCDVFVLAIRRNHMPILWLLLTMRHCHCWLRSNTLKSAIAEAEKRNNENAISRLKEYVSDDSHSST